MNVKRGKRFAGNGEPIPFPSLGVAQIAAAASPEQSIRSLFDDAPPSVEYLGRPLNVWRDDPSIARMINDHLSRDAA